MPAEVLEGTVSNVIPAQRTIMMGRGGGRQRLEVTVEHLSQIVMEFLRVARRVFRVAKVVLFQGRVARTLVEKGLYSAVDVSDKDILFALCNVNRDPSGVFFAFPCM